MSASTRPGQRIEIPSVPNLRDSLRVSMPRGVVKALVPTAAAASLLSREFPVADIVVDGTLFTVVIYAATYSDAVVRIRAWMRRTHLGPVLVTDDKSAEDLLTEGKPRRSRPFRIGEMTL